MSYLGALCRRFLTMWAVCIMWKSVVSLVCVGGEEVKFDVCHSMSFTVEQSDVGVFQYSSCKYCCCLHLINKCFCRNIDIIFSQWLITVSNLTLSVTILHVICALGVQWIDLRDLCRVFSSGISATCWLSPSSPVLCCCLQLCLKSFFLELPPRGVLWSSFTSVPFRCPVL